MTTHTSLTDTFRSTLIDHLAEQAPYRHQASFLVSGTAPVNCGATMNHYEKENAREWQMNLGNSPTDDLANNHGSKNNVEEDWTVVASRPVPSKRFAATSSKPANSQPAGLKPHSVKVNNTHGKVPNPPRSTQKPAAPGRVPNQPGISSRPPGRGPNQPGAIPQPPGRGPNQPVAISQPPGRGPNFLGAASEPRTRVPNETVARGAVSQTKAEANFPQAPPHSQAKPERIIGGNWFTVDNAARKAFRDRKPHNVVFTVDKNKSWDIIEPDRLKLFSRCEEIGVRFDSYVKPPQDLADRTLLLWGNEEQLARTITELQDWVLSSDNNAYGPREKMQLKVKNEKFARVGLLQKKKLDHLDKKMKEQAKMHQYQRNPEEGQEFAFQGYFLWPVEEVSPEELLGPSCEAYDPIRMYNYSHIIFEKKLSAFKILSNNEAAVKNALQRIEDTMREYVARGGKIYAYYMIQIPKASNALKDIKMLPGPDPVSKVPLLTGASLSSKEISDYVNAKKDMEASNQRKMRHALRKIIVRLPLYRGQLRMRAVFGTFTLSTFRWPGSSATVPLFDFVNNIDVPSTKGSLIRDLQCKLEPIELFARCTAAGGFLESLNSTYSSDHEELKPVYTACFPFQTPEIGSIRLEVEFSKPSGGQEIYEETRSQWIKNDLTESSVPLELNMMQVNGGSSWRLHVLSENLVDDTRITPQMADFADTVIFNPPPPGIRPELTGFKVFKYASNFRFESFEQKTALRFCHKDRGNWIFELARYDTFASKTATASGKTQWGAAYWNAEWDNTLSANLSLGIGQAAEWNPWFSTFFPKNPRTTNTGKDSGFQDFLQDAKYIAGMLDEMKGLPNDHVNDEGDRIDTMFS